MSKWLLAAFTLVIGTALVAPEAEARRFGGARSVGAQRNVTPPPAKPAAQQQAAPAQQQQGKWGGILGGLALGGLLGYLFAGNGLGGLLLFALLAIGAVMLFRTLARAQAQAPVQFAGTREQAAMPLAAGGGAPASADAAPFLQAAKRSFVKLQVANDAADLEEIREFTTDELFETVKSEVAARRAGQQHTEVNGLEADLLQASTEGDTHWASVRFRGTVRESQDGAAVPFEEVWNLVKPVDGSSGWLLAGIQQMH
ncbi:MAG TPA: Tim44-like domain-containing protein [Burkholderiales bacterium]|nr:Tim44-like domain-containing protein [Burkholderiales bacterium]